MRRVTSQVTIEAPRQRVWDLIADLEAVQEYNPGVQSAHLITEEAEGVGAGRHCELRPRGWVDEKIREWDAGRSYTIDIVESNLPIAGATAQFFFEEVEAGTLVTVNFDYEVKYGALGRVLDRLMISRRFDRAVPAIIGGAKRHIEAGSESERAVA